jgi:hypothetical protein
MEIIHVDHEVMISASTENPEMYVVSNHDGTHQVTYYLDLRLAHYWIVQDWNIRVSQWIQEHYLKHLPPGRTTHPKETPVYLL